MDEALLGTVRIPTRLQGPTGRGQGGWTACRFAEFADGPATIRLAAAAPLNVDLEVRRDGDGLVLIDPRETPAKIIMQAAPWTPDIPDTAPVAIADAAVARGRFNLTAETHPVPWCFSCGLHAEAMHVHPGPLADGRVAVDWRPPIWAVRRDRSIDPGVVWAALDCTSGFFAGQDSPNKTFFTAQFAVEIVRPVQPNGDYAVVAWEGDGASGWEGRKRTSVASMFDARGDVVARARAFWVAVA